MQPMWRHRRISSEKSSVAEDEMFNRHHLGCAGTPRKVKVNLKKLTDSYARGIRLRKNSSR